MKAAANNENGAMLGFAGLNMAGTAGASLLNAANQNGAVAQPAAPAAVAGVATGGAVPNFCPNCGTKTNGGNFCANCGTKLV
jgi:membrane protease subunit (stomatin/prohibitin family)